MKDLREYFTNHEAKVVIDDGRLCMIDFRNKNGSSDCYVNFIIDKKRGAFVVSGDLGSSMAIWYNPLNATDIKNYIRNVNYYAKKFCVLLIFTNMTLTI